MMSSAYPLKYTKAAIISITKKIKPSIDEQPELSVSKNPSPFSRDINPITKATRIIPKIIVMSVKVKLFNHYRRIYCIKNKIQNQNEQKLYLSTITFDTTFIFVNMFKITYFWLLIGPCFAVHSCSDTSSAAPKMKAQNVQQTIESESKKNCIDTAGHVVKSRFEAPIGYTRVAPALNSWSYFLQNLPLKPHGTSVKHYDGTTKEARSVYCAVIDLPFFSNKNYQCADAIMRLRADYLFSQQKFNEIEFWYGNNSKLNYTAFLAGEQPNTANLWHFLEKVYAYAGTLSLDQQLKARPIKELEIGDIFIKGGSPGHAVIVVDKCVNESGKVKFMLAQSYMPAQDLQILVGDDRTSPWYDLNFGDYLYSAQWTFTKDQLKRF